MTVTFNVVVAVAQPSLTCKVKLALPAPHAATMSAVIVPPALTIFEIVTPFDGLALVTVTIRLPTVSASLTVAIWEFEPGEPACRLGVAVPAKLGAVLAVTLTLTVAVTLWLWLLVILTVKLVLVAAHVAVKLAVTLPLAATATLLMVTPFKVAEELKFVPSLLTAVVSVLAACVVPATAVPMEVPLELTPCVIEAAVALSVGW